MKPCLVDTNVILRFLLNDIPEQAELARTILKQAEQEERQVTIPVLAFVELDFALTKLYRFRKAQSIEKLEALLSLAYLEIEEKQLMQQALSCYRSFAVSFVDAIFLFQAILEEKKLITFDKKLAKLAKDLEKEYAAN